MTIEELEASLASADASDDWLDALHDDLIKVTLARRELAEAIHRKRTAQDAEPKRRRVPRRR